MAKKKVSKKDLNQTEIVVVLDRSGSMGSISKATVDGFNKFLNEQQNSEGEGFITLVQFDDRYEVNYKSVPVKSAANLILGESFIPRGSTALLDAVGKTIEELNTDRDVVFVIITDGEENSSKVYKREAIFKMIETLTKEKNWKFLFLAANQDAIRAGGSLGINASNSITYTANSASTDNVFKSFSGKVASYRGSKSRIAASDLSDTEMTTAYFASATDLDFNQEDRKDAQTDSK